MTSNKKYSDDAKLLRSWGRSSSLFNDSEKIENMSKSDDNHKMRQSPVRHDAADAGGHHEAEDNI